jgi:hypothetical protein
MVLTLADKTGWPERFIIWELPLARALEYYHAALWAAGVWTVRNERSPAEELARLAAACVDDDDEL